MGPSAPLNSLPIRGLITWLSYTAFGVLAVLLSAPGDNVSTLYLPAGLGLACLIGWGPWMLLPIALGGAAVTLMSVLHPGMAAATTAVPPWPALVAVATLAGLAAALQAWVGWRLTALPGDQPQTLETPAQIGRFLLLAGPVACLISATISVTSRAAFGLMPWEAVPHATLGWWTGDTVGVLMGAPMMLTLVGQPAVLWRARRLLVGVPLLVATVLIGFSVRQVQSWSTEREEAQFQQGVAATANAVKLRLNGYQDAIAALASVFEASDHVTREEFSRASRYWVDSLKGVQATGWAQRVRMADVPAFEAAQQQEGLAGYKVFDTHAHLPPTERPEQELVVLRYIEPVAGNEPALGYNVLSKEATHAAYEQARRESRPVATRGLRLMQEKGQQTGVVVYWPIFRKDKGEPFTPQARVQANVGAVFLAMRMDDAVEAMLQGRPRYLQACLVDMSMSDHPVLGGTAACKASSARHAFAHQARIPLEFSARSWELVLWTDSPVPVVGLGATAWLLALGGVALAAALGALLLVMTGHARRIEAAMEEARQQRSAAETANQAKSDFLSRMSHELRTPLNAVLGFAQVMALDEREALPPSQRQRVEQIQQAGWHLLNMIDDVLDISRLDMGTLKLQAAPLRIRDELALADKLMREEAHKNGIELAMPSDVSEQWGVMADASRLRQIFSHLLSNAIKFNQRGGRIEVSVSQDVRPDAPPRVLVTVQDSGLGMNQAQVAQLFQPFNRLGREHGTAGGAGIGLAISRHLAVLMGGDLGVRSEEGKGSVFTLALPAVDMPPKTTGHAPRPTANREPPTSTPRPRHVLYVEDNQANSEVIRAALGARPWITVSVAPTTEEGLAVLHNRLRGSKPDLILLDVHLPDASGQELLKLIKANPDTADIPVIMISADAMPEQIDAALAAGAYCYLTKPVQLPELLRQVDELMPA